MRKVRFHSVCQSIRQFVYTTTTTTQFCIYVCLCVSLCCQIHNCRAKTAMQTNTFLLSIFALGACWLPLACRERTHIIIPARNGSNHFTVVLQQHTSRRMFVCVSVCCNRGIGCRMERRQTIMRSEIRYDAYWAYITFVCLH